MKYGFGTVAAIFALGSAVQAQAEAAAAAPECLTRGEIRGMVAYMMPTVLSAAAAKCAPGLPSTAFFATRAPQLITELEPGRAAAFPMAKQAFKKFGGKGDSSANAIFDALPEEAFGPIIEAVVSEKLTGEIKPESCGDIDRVMTAMAPLPGSNMIDLITEAVVLAARDDRKMRSCPES
jgi:hypothetical protein